MEIAQQNGSVWLRLCQSTHKKHSTAENKQPLISSESPQSLGKAAKTRHQLLSAGSLLWKSERRERKLVSLKGETRQKSGKKRCCWLPQQCFIPHIQHSLKNGGGKTHPKTSLSCIYTMYWEWFQWEFLMLFHIPWIQLYGFMCVLVFFFFFSILL